MEQPRTETGTRTDLVLYRIQTAKEDLQAARILLAAEEIRHASDYDDFYIASRGESECQVAVADEFIKLVDTFCMQQFKKND